VAPLALVGVIGGLVFAFATIFKKTWAPVTAPIYALFEGLVLGQRFRDPGSALPGDCHSGGEPDVRDHGGAAAGRIAPA
jgi:hypothetical protein